MTVIITAHQGERSRGENPGAVYIVMHETDPSLCDFLNPEAPLNLVNGIVARSIITASPNIPGAAPAILGYRKYGAACLGEGYSEHNTLSTGVAASQYAAIRERLLQLSPERQGEMPAEMLEYIVSPTGRTAGEIMTLCEMRLPELALGHGRK